LKSASKIGSSTSLRLACTHRSRAVGIPNRLDLPEVFGIIRSRTGSGANLRALRSSRSSRKELLTILGADRARFHSIDTSRSCSSIAPHTIPADHQEGRVADEIEQVIKPTIRTVDRPSVQLGLDLQYP